jgi:hypothetical protein
MECFVAYEIICMSLKDSVLNIEFYKKKISCISIWYEQMREKLTSIPWFHLIKLVVVISLISAQNITQVNKLLILLLYYVSLAPELSRDIDIKMHALSFMSSPNHNVKMFQNSWVLEHFEKWCYFCV